MSQRPDDRQDEIDWYGDRAKRKHQQGHRRAIWRGFGCGFVLTAIGAILIALFGVHSVIIGPLFSPYATITAPPETILQQAKQALTETAIAAPTMTTPTASPSITPSPIGSPAPRDQIESYRLIGNLLIPAQMLPVSADPGYQFSTIQVGTDGSLYVGYARTPDQNAACDPQEAIWHIAPNPSNAVTIWQSARIGHPKVIAPDSDGGAEVLAFDCTRQMWTLVHFDASGHLFSDLFSIVGGDALARSADGQIWVALSGFADQTALQPHLLTLQRDPQSGVITQIAQNYLNDLTGGHFSALHVDPTDAGHVIAIWSAPEASDRVLTLSDQAVAPTPVIGTITVTEAISQPIIATPTEIPIAAGLALHSSRADMPIHLIGLGFTSGQPIGLQADGRALITWDLAGQIRAIPIPAMIARAFAVDPASGLIYIIGQPG